MKRINYLKVLEYFFGGILLVQVALLCYFNLRDIRYCMDADMALGFYHFQEVLKNGTLNLQDWYNTTTLELDTTFLFAVPIYFITHDLFLAAGISSIIFIFLYIVVIYGILSMIRVSRTFIYFTLILVLTPYKLGMLDYFNMLFFGVSWYRVKVLVPLIMLWLILLIAKKEDAKKNRLKIILVSILFVGMLFVTSVSTGIYTMMCGIAPIVICMILDIWHDGKLNAKYNLGHLWLVLGSVIVFLSGNSIYNQLYHEEHRSDMSLTKASDYTQVFQLVVKGIYHLFNAFPEENMQAMSYDGVIYCLRLGLVTLFIIAFIANIPKIFKKNEKLGINYYLAMLGLFNYVILTICDTRNGIYDILQHRYLLIGAVPIIILFGIQVSQWLEKSNDFQKMSAQIALMLCLAILVLGNNKEIMDKWDRSSYAVNLCEYFDTLDVESVFLVDDLDTALKCRALDRSRKYAAFSSKQQTLCFTFCSYFGEKSGSFYGKKNALAVIQGNQLTDLLPEQIAQHYTYVDTVNGVDIYVSDQVWFP